MKRPDDGDGGVVGAAIPAGPAAPVPRRGHVAVATLADLPDHGLVEVGAGGVAIVLCRLGDDVFAVSATCPHQGTPLAGGRLDGAHLDCPMHRARFDVRTGFRVTAPVCPDLRSFPTEVRDGTVWVDTAGREAAP